MILETKRLFLRPWEERDAESLYFYARDPDVGPHAGWPPHKNESESLSVIRNALSGKECYAVCRKEDGLAIGSIELMLFGHTDLAETPQECELGYWIGKPFWGRGIIPEAAEALLCRAFTQLGMTKVWCGYYDGNDRSRRVQEKLGFEYHHTNGHICVFLLGETRVGHVNVLTKERWESRNAPASH